MPDTGVHPEDSELFQRYANSRPWNEAPAADHAHLRELRSRLKAIARSGREAYPGTILVTDFVSVLNPNGRTPKDYWCCIYPQSVPNKSYGLQIALIVGPAGCEVCFCLGAGTSQERDPQKIALNASALARAKARLAHTPSELRRSIEAACKEGGWSFRKTWRKPQASDDFGALEDWLVFAASPNGDAASISKNLPAKTLAADPQKPSEVFRAAGQLFAPLLDHVYTDGTNKDPLPPFDPQPDAEVVGQHKVRHWVLAAGEGSRLWPDFQENGLAAIGWDRLGDMARFSNKEEIAAAITATFGTENPINDALACHQFVHEMAVGDYLYIKKGRGEIVAYGVVTSDYRYAADRPEYRNVRDVDWLSAGLWSLPSGRLLPQKTLTEIAAEDAKFIEGLVTGQPSGPEAISPTTYDMQDALEELFIDRDDLGLMLTVVGRKKNLILAGPPGVGKTFAARRLAYLVLGEIDAERVQLIQFHQSLTYEDFVQGWRPSRNGQFEVRPGPFLRFAERARTDRERKYVLIIDEINRGNLSKIFGDLLMLLEADKRDSSYAIPLTYASLSDPPFLVPPNLYIIGMMNTADRSLALVDYALRRRFGFVKMRPRFESGGFRKLLSASGASDDIINRIIHRLTTLNNTIAADSDLGMGFVIGHSYFLPTGHEEELDEKWYRQIVLTDVVPLLEEYWFDRNDQVQAAAGTLLA